MKYLLLIFICAFVAIVSTTKAGSCGRRGSKEECARYCPKCPEIAPCRCTYPGQPVEPRPPTVYTPWCAKCCEPDPCPAEPIMCLQ